MSKIDRTKLRLSIWDIVRQLNDLNEQSDEIIVCIPQNELDEIANRIEQFKKFSVGVSGTLITAKAVARLKKELVQNA